MRRFVSAVFLSFGDSAYKMPATLAASRRAKGLGRNPSPFKRSQTAAYSSQSFIR